MCLSLLLRVQQRLAVTCALARPVCFVNVRASNSSINNRKQICFDNTFCRKKMAPKTKKAASKDSSADKKNKKDAGNENGTEKVPERQSKRNVDKVVNYKEVAENVDEKTSENQPRKVMSPKAKAKGKNSKRKNDSEPEDLEDSGNEQSAEESTKKESRTKGNIAKKEGPAAKKAKTDGNRMNKVDTKFDGLDFSSDKTTADGKPWNIKLSSWNVGGLKAWLKKGALDFVKHEDPDIFCLQETRCSEKAIPEEAKINGYHTYWVSGEKDGYAGVGLYTKVKPIEVLYGLGKKEHDSDGRLITAEYEKFYLVVAYVPNAGRGLVTLPKRLKWDPDFRAYLKELDDKKPVILCGDLNVAHEAIDLANPKTNVRNAGFTQEERDGMTELLKAGFVDTYRHLNPDKTGAYTFWTYMGNARSRNVGWRLDYFVISEKLVPNLCDNIIRSEVYGSDHCPLTLLLNL